MPDTQDSADDFAIGTEGKNLAVDEKPKLGGDGNVKLDGVLYTATKHMISSIAGDAVVEARSKKQKLKDTRKIEGEPRKVKVECPTKMAKLRREKWRKKFAQGKEFPKTARCGVGKNHSVLHI